MAFAQHASLLLCHQPLLDGDLPGFDGIPIGILRSRLAGILVEDSRLLSEQFDDARIDPLIGQKAVNLYGSLLSHAVRSSDGLYFERGLELGLAENHDRGCLNVEALASGLDLGQKNAGFGGVGELVDDLLSPGGTHTSTD